MSPDEKQKTKNSYKFIQFNIPLQTSIIDIKKLKLQVKNFNSNEELLKLVIEDEACNETYQRHFKINKLFK